MFSIAHVNCLIAKPTGDVHLHHCEGCSQPHTFQASHRLPWRTGHQTACSQWQLQLCLMLPPNQALRAQPSFYTTAFTLWRNVCSDPKKSLASHSHWHTCPGEPLVQRNCSAKGQSGWDYYFTFSKAIKGKADPHDLQGGNGTPFKILTLVSKSLVHEPLFHLEKGYPAEDEDWCSSVLPTALSIFRWNSLLYKQPHVESLVQTCGWWKKDRGSSLSLLPTSSEEHAHRRAAALKAHQFHV